MLLTRDERLKLLTQYEQRTHPVNDVRELTFVTTNTYYRRCRGGVILESHNRFGGFEAGEVQRAIRKVHDRL
jgi:hypothetical protein